MAEGPDIREYRDLDPATRVLMGPGPSDVPPRVLRALAAPTLGHLDPEFLTVMSETQQLLRAVFQTDNALTIPVSGTGSAGMEACFVNLVEPGDQVAVVVNGVFGTRMVDCAGRLGAEVIPIEAEWGRAVAPEAVEAALKGRQPKIFAVVHAETSTGVCQPLPDIIKVVKDAGALMMLDCVTSLGGVKVTLDEWGIDAAFSGTQKCLSCPPGLAPLSFNDEAWGKVASRKTKVPSWYLDLTMVGDYWGSARKYHHTAPVNMIYALRESLRIILEEGLEARFARHRLNHRALVAGVEAMGLGMLVPEGERLASLNTVTIPEGVDDAAARKALLQRFGLEIGAGLGPLAGKVWRVGLQGHSCTERNVMLFLTALETVLRAQGVKLRSGGPDAAAAVYAEAGTPQT
jgi:alanine-glyoxylate transaminase / serine-glyoxylate transaminase / serine-pyruvate transaminase